jgi:hypothetical protein
MIKKLFAGLLLAAALTMTASAQVSIRIGPPRNVSERRPVAPARGYVWIPGYQNWNGQSYVWTQGRWEQPPRRNAKWNKHHWVKRNGGWLLIEGRWR